MQLALDQIARLSDDDASAALDQIDSETCRERQNIEEDLAEHLKAKGGDIDPCDVQRAAALGILLILRQVSSEDIEEALRGAAFSPLLRPHVTPLN